MFEEMDKDYSKYRVFGFLFSFLVFTVILYFVINYIKGDIVPYNYVALISSGITITGLIIKRLLK